MPCECFKFSAENARSATNEEGAPGCPQSGGAFTPLASDASPTERVRVTTPSVLLTLSCPANLGALCNRHGQPLK
jgi:hypothetical protein